MNKPQDLRNHLQASVPWLRKNPENLHIFVEKGNIVSRLGGGMSFEYRYELNLLVTDYTDHSDTLIIPLLAWISVNQTQLLQNPDQQENGIKFEAEIIDHETADINITIALTESVVVTKTGNSYTAEHIAEPALTDLTGPTGWELYLNDVLFAPQP